MDDARFQSMVAAMPLVSVDLVVVRGGAEVLLGDDQHAALRWWPLADAAGSGVVHPGAH